MYVDIMFMQHFDEIREQVKLIYNNIWREHELNNQEQDQVNQDPFPQR